MTNVEQVTPAYIPKLPQRDYQEEACRRMWRRPAFALLHAMRTGKTKTLLDDFGALESVGEVQDLLVIAPAGCYRTWESEIDKHVADTLRRRLRVYTWISKTSRTDAAGSELRSFLADRSGPRVFLVNVEALSISTTKAREACEAFIADRRVMVAVDESTVIKNYKAKRTKYIVEKLAPRAKYRRILSGLPTPRSPLDLYMQCQFLDARILREPSYLAFMHHYAVVRQTTFGGRLRRPANIVVGYCNQEQLRELIAPHSHRVEFRPDIPSTYTTREVPLTDDQRKIYEALKTKATAEIEAAGAHVTATLVIVQILRMHQILCGHVVDESGQMHDVKERRTDTLMDLLEDYAGKAVIWCSYDHDVRKVSEAIASEYDPACITYDAFGNERKIPPKFPNDVVARFWGGNEATREDEEKSFKTDPRCRFMVATPGAGGRGRTWDVADLVVYYSSTNNLEHREQSEQRAQNVGKTRQVDYIDLIAPGTVDEAIIKALRAKIDMATVINGDNYREWLI